MKNLKKFVCNLDVIISGLSLCAIVVITLAGVIMRKIMNQPIAWLEEMQLLLFIYAIFFGGSVAFRYGNQVSIDLVMNRLKGKAARVLEIFDVVVTVIGTDWDDPDGNSVYCIYISSSERSWKPRR